MPKFLQRRGKLPERSGARGAGAPVSVLLLLRAATLRCEQSVRGVSEVIQEQQDALPPCFGGIKKEKEAENTVRVYVKPEDAALSERATEAEARQVQRRVEAPSPSYCCAPLQRLRCADGIRTWKQQPGGGGSGRPGEMQAEEETAEAAEEKRYNFTTLVSPFLCLFFPLQRSCAPRRGSGARGGARAASASALHATLRGGWSSRTFPKTKNPETMKVKTRVVLRGAVNDAVFFSSLSKFSCCCVYCCFLSFLLLFIVVLKRLRCLEHRRHLTTRLL